MRGTGDSALRGSARRLLATLDGELIRSRTCPAVKRLVDRVRLPVMPDEPAYVSRVKIERLGGPQRLAYLPAEAEPVAFGVHSEVAEHYGVTPEQYPPHATTLDYVVAAAGG